MEDSRIIELYWAREEAAIRETENKYGRYLATIAYHVLADSEDSKEVVNDTYLKAWNSMPTHRPGVLSTYLGKIARELSIDRYRKRISRKRGGTEYAISLSELEDCVAGGPTPEQEVELKLLADAISSYLWSLPEETRNAFVSRYFFLDPIKEIAGFLNASESRVKSMLYRARLGLKDYLIKEGFYL